MSEFEASLVYRVSSRTARATQRNSVLENKQTKKISVSVFHNLIYSIGPMTPEGP